MLLHALAILAQGKTISFENSGLRLELFLKEIERQTGETYRCPIYLKNEVIAASFENQTIESVKSQLARVIHAGWEKKPDGWWLDQTSDQKKEEVKWNLDQRRAFLAKQIETLRKNIPDKVWGAKEAEKYCKDLVDSRRRTGEGIWTSAQRRQLRFRGPQYRFEQRVGSMLDANMFPGDGLVYDLNRYCSNGLRSHLSINLDATSAMADFASERDMYMTISANDKGTSTLDPFLPMRSDAGPPVHLEVSVENGEVPYLDMVLYDRNWKYVAAFSPGYDGLSEFFRSSRTKFESFVMSEKTKAMDTLSNSSYLGMADPTSVKKIYESAEYLEMVSTMQSARTKDPLGLLIGRCWIDFAHGVHRPLLVNLTETTGGRLNRISIPQLNPDLPAEGMMRVDADGWILGHPINPLYNRSWRMDRSEIERWTRLRTSPDAESLEKQIQSQDILDNSELTSQGIPFQDFFSDSPYEMSPLGILGGLLDQKWRLCLQGGRRDIASLAEKYQRYKLVKLLGGELKMADTSQGDLMDYCPFYAFPNGVQGMMLTISITPDFSFDLENPSEDEKLFELFRKQLREGKVSPETKVKWQNVRNLTMKILYGKTEFESSFAETIRNDLPFVAWKSVPDNVKQQIAIYCRTIDDSDGDPPPPKRR